jgi:hypothetical protein
MDILHKKIKFQGEYIMKKRIISLLLLLGTVLSLFPVAGIAAEEVLPKDETPGAQSETVAEENALTDYEKLYVGADGGKTANGGELIAFYTAMGEDVASVNLTAKTWSDKLGKAADATLIGNGWVTYAKGGFGYDYAYNDFKSKAGNYGLALPEELLLPDLYIETLAKVKTTRTQQALSRIGKLTLRDFNSEMAGLKSDEEKLSYSYMVMISLLSELNTSLRAADTPRELAGKIAATMEFPQIGEITNLIEEIKYAEAAGDADTSARVLTSVRTMVERHLV